MIENIEDLDSGLDIFFRPGSVTPTTPLVSPTSDESEQTFTCQTSPTSKSSVKSALLKPGGGGETPRSRSNDNLEKYAASDKSPLVQHKTVDSPCSGAKRTAKDDSSGGVVTEKDSMSPVCGTEKKDALSPAYDNKKLATSPLASNKHKQCLGEEIIKELPKSPVFKSIAKDKENKPSEAGKIGF